MHLEEARAQLTELIFGGCTVQELLDACEGLLGTPLRLTFHSGSRGSILSQGYPPEDFRAVRAAIQHDQDPYARHNDRLREQGLLPAQPKPLLYLPEQEDELIRPRLVCEVISGAVHVGYLTIPEVEVPLARLDEELITLCARLCALCVLQSDHETETGRGRQAMLYLLLGAPEIRLSEVSAIAGASLPDSGRYRLLCIRQLPAAGHGKPLAERCALRLHTDLVHQAKHLTTLLFDADRWTPDARQHLLSDLHSFGGVGLVSPVFDQLKHTALWRGRLLALPAFTRAEESALLDYADWADHGVLAASGFTREELWRMLPPVLLSLRDWDQTHATSYIPTLQALLAYSGSQRRTAQALDTHVNTIAYRLQRMDEQFGLNLDEPEMPYRLSWGLRVMGYLELL